MIGTWMLDEQFAYKHLSSEHLDDAPPGALKHTFFYEGGGGQKHVTDYITKTRYASRLSHRALHDLCMCAEATRVGQMIFALRKARATIFEIKTDSCLYRPTRRSDKLFLPNLRYTDMAKIRDLCENQGHLLL